MIFVSLILITVFLFFIINRLKFTQVLDLVLAVYLLLCAHIVLAFEISSLLGELSSPITFLCIQMVFVFGAGVFFFVKKAPSTKIHFAEAVKQLWKFVTEHKLLTFLFCVVAIVSLFEAHLSTWVPQNTSDSLYNHLSRIAHWLQQGSLKPYTAFNYYGITYPYNNSLLMMWSMLFLHSDRYVGLVQWLAAVMLSLSIYGLATQLHFSKTQAAFSALTFLTFPILIFQSITAQNDILVAAFFVIGVYFFIAAFQRQDRTVLFLSALSIGLSAGTKQYLAFTIPGFVLIFIYFLCQRNIPLRFILARDFVAATISLTLLVGSYAYIQNFVYYGDPTGLSDSEILVRMDPRTFGEKLAYNSIRLTTQFITCEGLPIPLENRCLQVKKDIFEKVFVTSSFNLEADKFMLEPDCGTTCFSFASDYPLNEESAWFGILSWILLLPSCIIALVQGIHKKELLPVLLVLTSFTYFFIISVFKAGWDAYVGRYLILSVALLMPFSGYLLAERTWLQKAATVLFSLLAIFILVYSILTNDSKPLVNQKDVFQIQKWGVENHEPLVKGIGFKLQPWFRDGWTIYDYSPSGLRTYFANYMNTPVDIVKKYVPLNSSMGIVADNGIFLDYIFFGDSLTRQVYDLPDYANGDALKTEIYEHQIQYLLVKPDIRFMIPRNFKLVVISDGWQLYKKK